jgi:hypothetical protein
VIWVREQTIPTDHSTDFFFPYAYGTRNFIVRACRHLLGVPADSPSRVHYVQFFSVNACFMTVPNPRSFLKKVSLSFSLSCSFCVQWPHLLPVYPVGCLSRMFEFLFRPRVKVFYLIKFLFVLAEFIEINTFWASCQKVKLLNFDKTPVKKCLFSEESKVSRQALLRTILYAYMCVYVWQKCKFMAGQICALDLLLKFRLSHALTPLTSSGYRVMVT